MWGPFIMCNNDVTTDLLRYMFFKSMTKIWWSLIYLKCSSLKQVNTEQRPSADSWASYLTVEWRQVWEGNRRISCSAASAIVKRLHEVYLCFRSRLNVPDDEGSVATLTEIQVTNGFIWQRNCSWDWFNTGSRRFWVSGCWARSDHEGKENSTGMQ